MFELRYLCNLAFYSILTRVILYIKTGRYCHHINSLGGLPCLNIRGILELPHNDKVFFVNNSHYSTLGNSRPCKLYVYKDAKLAIKGKCGLSNAVIVATKNIEIGKNVMIGGGVTIVDSDFHSMDYNDWFTDNDAANVSSAPVCIEDNVFVGMNSIILKGVHIGERAIIAAGSVVTKDVPSDEVWGGNPARFIKKR